MAKKNNIQQTEQVEPLNVDLSDLLTSEPEEIAAEVDMEMAPSKEDGPNGQDKSVVTQEDFLNKGFESVLAAILGDPDQVFEVERSVWQGRKKKFDGMRRLLNRSGFSITEKEHASGNDGRLASAVYSNGEEGLRIQYSKGDNYAHLISAE